MDYSTTNSKPCIVVICGPTCIGKTSFAIKMAKSFNGEIISADSMQIYKHMDIGTAKPTSQELDQIHHHMIDIVNPDEHFDASMFSDTARKIIFRLAKQNIIPFVVGGTGLYIKALLYGIFKSNLHKPDVRMRLKNEAVLHNDPTLLYKRLCDSDPEAASKIHQNDTYRIIRALEIYEITGQPISKYHNEHRFAQTPFNVLKIGLNMSRKTLYEKIDARVDAMIDNGLVDEVEKLAVNYSQDLKSMKSIGYLHINKYLNNLCPWDKTVEIFKRDTRRYAKRQLTWFNADSDIIWRHPQSIENSRLIVKNFLDGKKARLID